MRQVQHRQRDRETEGGCSIAYVEPDQKRSLLQGADQSLNHNLHVPLICNDNDNDTRQTCAHPVQFSSGGRAQAYIGVNMLDCHAA